MKKLIVTLAYIALLAACAGPVGPMGPEGKDGVDATTTTTTTLPVDTVQEEIDEIVSLKNYDRSLVAQAPLTSGLSCTVQAISSGSCLSTSSPGCAGLGFVMTGSSYTYLYTGNFNQPNSSGSTANSLLPTSIQPLFVNTNHRIVCSGQIVVTESNYYEFTLSSDDGSILQVGGTQVITNDGNHGMVTKTGTVLLYRGVNSFTLQYAQSGGGNFGIILTSGGSSIESKHYYH